MLMTADTVGGVWTYSLDLAGGLIRHGIGVTIAAMGGPCSARQRDDAAAIDGLTVREGDYRLEWMPEPWDDVRASGEWLLRLAGETRPDLVHLNTFSHGALAWSCPSVLVGHSCVLSWWRAVKGEPAPMEWSTYRRHVAQGLHGADVVVAPTRAMLDALELHYGPLAAKQVIPNGRDPDRFRPAPKQRIVLAAGRLWDEAKNVAALEAIASELDARVALAGAGRAERPHPQNVEPLGTLGPAELAGWMGRAAVFAHPARYEPFGLAVLEAALSGCGLVLGDIDTLRENWDGAALFVDPDDGTALRRAIERLLDDTSTRERLGAIARRRARALTAERMVAGYLDLYADLLDRNVEERSPCAS